MVSLEGEMVEVSVRVRNGTSSVRVRVTASSVEKALEAVGIRRRDHRAQAPSAPPGVVGAVESRAA